MRQTAEVSIQTLSLEEVLREEPALVQPHIELAVNTGIASLRESLIKEYDERLSVLTTKAVKD